MPGPSLKTAAEVMRIFADLEFQLATSLEPRVVELITNSICYRMI